MKYKCIKGVTLEQIDDDGFSIENEYMNIDEGTIWFIPEHDSYRFIDGEVRLENDDAEWIEICEETLKEHFIKLK